MEGEDLAPTGEALPLFVSIAMLSLVKRTKDGWTEGWMDCEAWQCIVLYRIVLYRIVSCRIVSYRIVLYCNVWISACMY